MEKAEKARRQTPRKKAISQIIENSCEPMTAEEIFEKVSPLFENLAITTVYRTLDAMEQSGEISRSIYDDGVARYICSKTHRHFLTCLKCRKSVAIEGCPFEAVEEEISLLCHGVSHLAGGFIDESIDIDERIKALETEIKMFNMFYDDGNYGRAWRNITYAYGHLGHLYFEKGNREKAFENLKMSALLAKRFDETDRITTMRSTFFSGREFDKHTLGSTYTASTRMYELMTEKYPFSDEFKETREFK